jgi:Phage Terminase
MMVERRSLRNSAAAISIDAALVDPQLLGVALGEPETWEAWLIVLKAAFGLAISDGQRKVFTSVAGTRAPPTRRVRELWCLVGRRGGKSRIAAALAVYFACFVQHRLARGEHGMVLVLAASQEQAKVVFNYAKAFLTESLVLRQEIAADTRHEIRLNNGVTIAVHANSFRSVRGRTLCACIFDEVAFWRDETTATPDAETYTAVLPALLTTNGMLIGISTPYRRMGLLHQKWRDHFDQDSDDVLVVQGSSKQFNPSLSDSAIEAQRASDTVAAASEWDAEFRTDIATFLDDQLIEAAIEHGRPLELPPRPGISYKCFVDPSGGRGDAYTIAIGHKERECLVIDVLRGKYPPLAATSFDPHATTEEFAALAKQYHCNCVMGDNFSAEWCHSAWNKLASSIKSRSCPNLESIWNACHYSRAGW